MHMYLLKISNSLIFLSAYEPTVYRQIQYTWLE